MGKQKEIEKIKKLFKEIRKKQNDNVIIGYIDDDQLAREFIDAGFGSKERFEIKQRNYMYDRPGGNPAI